MSHWLPRMSLSIETLREHNVYNSIHSHQHHVSACSCIKNISACLLRWVNQTPLLGLHMYAAPGVYSDGSPVMLYGDGVFCGPTKCPPAVGDTWGHASFGAPPGRPCAIEAKAATVDNTSRAVFMAQGLYNAQDDRVQHFFQHKLLNMLCLQLHAIYISVNGMRLLYKQVWPGQTISCSHILHNAYLPHQSQDRACDQVHTVWNSISTPHRVHTIT